MRAPQVLSTALLCVVAACANLPFPQRYCETSAGCADDPGMEYCDTVAHTCIPSPFDAMPEPPDARTSYDLTATFNGTGGGTLLIFVPDITCTSSCTTSFPVGTKISVYGAGDSSSIFAGFTGDCVGDSCTLTMDEDHDIGMAFVPNQCTPNTSTCDNNTNIFTRCGSTGTVVESRSCALGCHPTIERCNDVNPSNGLSSSLDYYDGLSQKLDLTLPDGAVIDTSAETVMDSAGNPIAVTATMKSQSGAPEIFVLVAKSMHVGNVVVKGTRALALVSNGDVTIEGILQLDAIDEGPLGLDWDGPGSLTTCDGSNGYAGGSGNPGGGGGGHGVAGAKGGDSGASIGASGSAQQNDATAAPLRGGCRGGDGFGGHGLHGRGGGAVQVVSRSKIALGSAAVISANGAAGGGLAINSCTSIQQPECGLAGGGGAGGTILLEAPLATVGSAAVLAANGGGGGCADQMGSPGSRSAMPAAGCTPSRGGRGGAGGAGSTAPQPGVADAAYGGGGGGAYGRVRVNTAQTFAPGTATISPNVSLGTLSTR